MKRQRASVLRMRDETAAALIRLVRHDAGSRADDRLRELLSTDAGRMALHGLASQHGVLAVALTGLEAAGARDPLLAEACRPLLAQRAVIRRQAALWDLETDRMLRLLDAYGLQPMTLKGAALRVANYRDSSERTFGDVDLLLPEPDVINAVTCLTAAGYALGDETIAARYRRYHFHYLLTNPMGFLVELHWALQPPSSVIRLRPERILARSRTIERPRAPAIRIPSPEDMVLHLSHQETEDWFSTIRRLVDVDRILRTESAFDWDYLRAAAAESGMRPVLGLTLQLARQLLSAPIPTGFIRSLELSRSTRFHLALLNPLTSVPAGALYDRATAPRYLAIWIAPDPKARRRTMREIATDRFDHFEVPVEIPVPALRTWSRRLGGLAKLSAFWLWLYLRRAGQILRRASARQSKFWEDPPGGRGEGAWLDPFPAGIQPAPSGTRPAPGA